MAAIRRRASIHLGFGALKEAPEMRVRVVCHAWVVMKLRVEFSGWREELPRRALSWREGVSQRVAVVEPVAAPI